jgi:hypothetical protein
MPLSPADYAKNDVNFVLCVLSLEELGARGNKGLAGLVNNPVHSAAIAGLATSATAQATVEVRAALLGSIPQMCALQDRDIGKQEQCTNGRGMADFKGCAASASTINQYCLRLFFQTTVHKTAAGHVKDRTPSGIVLH